MTPELFFQTFDELADAPGAVAKMRELVLELATSGRLVEQSLDDEPAAACLSRLRLTDAAISSDDLAGPDPLPATWTWVRFDGVATVQGGLTLGRKFEECAMTTLPYLRVANVKRAEIDVTSLKEVTIPEAEVQKYALAYDDLLMTEGGDWDKVGRAAIWKAQIPVCLHQNHVFRIRMRLPAIEPAWFELYFNSPAGRRYFAAAAKQTTNLASINMRQVRNCRVPFPPLAEQKRIVARVDELMALCDRLEAQQREREERQAALARAALARFTEAPTPENLRYLFHGSYEVAPAELRKTILTLAVRGKLVPFDGETEDGSVGDHLDFLNGYAFKSNWFKSNGVRLCRNINVGHGKLNWDKANTACVDQYIADGLEQFSLQAGDIVLSLDRPLISTGLKVAQVTQSDLPSLLLQRVAKAVPKHNRVDMRYFLLWLNSPEFVDAIDPGRSKGVPHISTREVQRVSFRLPPLIAQRRIVAKVDVLMALVDRLEAQLTASRAAATRLLEAVVAELTAAERGVEPAAGREPARV